MGRIPYPSCTKVDRPCQSCSKRCDFGPEGGNYNPSNTIGARVAARIGFVATHIRRLGRGDERLLRTTRLEALRDAPAAFGTSLEAARSRPDDFWQRQVDGLLGDQPCATWIALDDVGDGVGMLTGVELEGA